MACNGTRRFQVTLDIRRKKEDIDYIVVKLVWLDRPEKEIGSLENELSFRVGGMMRILRWIDDSPCPKLKNNNFPYLRILNAL